MVHSVCAENSKISTTIPAYVGISRRVYMYFKGIGDPRPTYAEASADRTGRGNGHVFKVFDHYIALDIQDSPVLSYFIAQFL